MILYILFYLVSQYASLEPVDASPIQNISSSYSLPKSISSLNTTTLDFELQICDCFDQRSVLDIIWSCASTLFLCTWVAIHPNVPDPNEEDWKPLWRRLKIMYWSFLAPELVLTWAFRQYVGARMILHQHKGPGRSWTMKHAHFLQMGGFHLRSKEYTGVLDPKKFNVFLKKQKISFPNITKEEIQDKSKADGLAKIVLIVQTLWFVIQCIGRHAQGLPLAQLEVATLAIISSTSMLSLMWWSKPFDVRYPIYLHAAEEQGCTSHMTVVEDEIHQRGTVLNGSCDTSEGSEGVGAEEQEYTRLLDNSDEVNHSVNGPTSQGITPTTGPLYQLDDINVNDATMVTNENHTLYTGRVSMYFAIDQADPNKYMDELKANAIPLSCGTLFGLMHCIAWDAYFLTTVEKTLWRISAIAVPVSLNLLLFISTLIDLSEEIENAYDAIWAPISIIMYLLPLAYSASRYYLILESLLALRAPPFGMLETVQWTNFLPHI
ncbi:hypothetical protein BDQ17DRAFT_1502277 [Cyathus striatus]|nr:hypothetical protein BDQ17DRAFT_1502277 [Cyathus striatus]